MVPKKEALQLRLVQVCFLVGVMVFSLNLKLAMRRSLWLPRSLTYGLAVLAFSRWDASPIVF